MHIAEILDKSQPAFSFEFFPPKDDESSERLFQTISNLRSIGPAYVSVTYGAGGSSRERTRDVVVRIQKETNLTVVSHLTCVGDSKEELSRILENFIDAGIENFLALRGDPPIGQNTFEPVPDGFAHATELVAFIKKRFPHIGIGIAGYPEGHPEITNRLKEIDYLKAKVDAGADYICTQLFFDNKDFYDFCERCELAGIKVPILAGIMPITTEKGMYRMADLSKRSRFPARLLKALGRADNAEDFAKIGTHWATEQVLDLLDNNVRGIHFYTLNRSKTALKVYDALGISKGQSQF